MWSWSSRSSNDNGLWICDDYQCWSILCKYKKTRQKKQSSIIKKGWSGDQVGKSCKDRDGPTLYWGSWAWRTGQLNHFQKIIKKITFSVDQLLWAARQSDRVLGTSERMWLWREQRGKGLNLKIKLKYSVVLVSPKVIN